MSVHVSSRVWKESTQKGNALLLLLALADMANDEGECWPSVESLRRRLRMGTTRGVQLVLAKLEKDGEIVRDIGAGRSSQNIYYLPKYTSPPEQEFTPPLNERSSPPLNGRSPKSSVLNHQLATKRAAKPPPAPLGPGSTILKEICRLTPSIPLRDKIEACCAKVGEDHFREVALEWIGRGYRPNNFTGILDVVEHGWQNGKSGKPVVVAETRREEETEVMPREYFLGILREAGLAVSSG